tara:strand:- start:96 stop:2129 length:2034 start_codon:yes stop_codon:yes gene_type:complete
MVALVVMTVPFIMHESNDSVEALLLSDSTVGNYQSTTCKISLSEFYFKNISQDINIYYNNNNYADVNCFGKITGVDKVRDGYVVSIGTNSSANIILQSFVWVTLLFIIPKKKNNNKKFSVLPIFILPFIIILQFVGESRFYRNDNVLFDGIINLQNYYFILTFLNILLLSAFINEVIKNRVDNLINYLPFIFLFTGTYTGNNLNIYFIFGAILGLHDIINSFKNSEKSIFNYVDYIYFTFSIIWLNDKRTSDYFFDTDKLRGFINSSNTLLSEFYWVVMFYLFVRGLMYLFSETINKIEFSKIKTNFLISGSLIVVFGYLGSVNPFINFFNMLFFGQNKRGMKVFSSIEGNTWRGFSPSAESIGEFFGFVILFYLIYLIDKKGAFKSYDFLLFIPIFYGLYRSNNFAAILSTSLLFLYILFKNYSTLDLRKRANSKYIILLLSVLVILISFFYVRNDYEYLSTELIYEATLHQDFFSSGNSYKNYLSVEQKMIERDLETLLSLDDNYLKASSSYMMLVNIFTPSFNIPLIPNIVGVLSIIAFYINRTEMWGIFIAKYNPDIMSGVFGYGPLQMNEYLSEHNVRLDVPVYEQSGLFLPHSSLLDFLIFFGLAGTSFLIFLLFKVFKDQVGIKSNIKYILVFLSVNLLKSDSILYLNSFILLLFAYSLTKYRDTTEIKE